MEIYYCQTCGLKIDSETLARGGASRSGDAVFCASCVPAQPQAQPQASVHTPAKPPPRVPTGGNERARNRPAPQAPQFSQKTFGLVVLGLGAAILVLGALLFFKKRSDSESENIPPKVEPPAAIVTPTVTTTPPKSPAELEKAADEEFKSIMHSAGTRAPGDTADLLDNFLKRNGGTKAAEHAIAELNKIRPLRKILADGYLTLATIDPPGEDWGFHDGREFPGATGSMAKDSKIFKEGKQSLRLSGDFTKGGSYVSAWHGLKGSQAGDLIATVPYSKFICIRLWVKTKEATRLGLRISDSTEQCHQSGIAIPAKDDWQQIEITRLTSTNPNDHWGGANDGSFHWPISGFGFLLGADACGPGKKADIWIDQIELVVR